MFVKKWHAKSSKTINYFLYEKFIHFFTGKLVFKKTYERHNYFFHDSTLLIYHIKFRIEKLINTLVIITIRGNKKYHHFQNM